MTQNDPRRNSRSSRKANERTLSFVNVYVDNILGVLGCIGLGYCS